MQPSTASKAACEPELMLMPTEALELTQAEADELMLAEALELMLAEELISTSPLAASKVKTAN